MSVWFVPTVIILPLIAFYLWMFWEMLNDYSLPPEGRYYWTLGFVFLNVIAAGYYYFAKYNHR